MTHLYIPASVATVLAKSPLTGQYNLSSLQHVYSGAAMLSKEVLNASRSNLRISQTEQGNTYGPIAFFPYGHICMYFLGNDLVLMAANREPYILAAHIEDQSHPVYPP